MAPAGTKPDDRRMHRILDELFRGVLQMGGVISGEHGIGLHKMDFLIAEAGAGAVAMMRSIKQALDPLNILNPGKIFALEA